MQNSNSGERFGGHYGLEFALNCSSSEVDAKIEELKREEEDSRSIAKPNRRAKAKNLLKSSNNKGSEFAKLNESLKLNLNTSLGEVIEADLNRKFRNLWKLRSKN